MEKVAIFFEWNEERLEHAVSPAYEKTPVSCNGSCRWNESRLGGAQRQHWNRSAASTFTSPARSACGRDPRARRVPTASLRGTAGLRAARGCALPAARLQTGGAT